MLLLRLRLSLYFWETIEKLYNEKASIFGGFSLSITSGHGFNKNVGGTCWTRTSDHPVMSRGL